MESKRLCNFEALNLLQRIADYINSNANDRQEAAVFNGETLTLFAGDAYSTVATTVELSYNENDDVRDMAKGLSIHRRVIFADGTTVICDKDYSFESALIWLDIIESEKSIAEWF